MRDKQHKPSVVRVVKWSVVLAAFIAVVVYYKFGGAIVALLFIVAFALDVSPSIPLGVSLGVLLLAPVMLALDQKSAANTLATWSYCFLALGISIQLYHFLRERGEEADKPADKNE